MIDTRNPENPRPIGVVIADKNPIILSGLERVFNDASAFNVVAVAADGDRFLEAVSRLAGKCPIWMAAVYCRNCAIT